ncbi:hypothetical protein [Shewanella algae]|uniref:hypothetical protein n=1 Tax=Shewanella algae TaxID=38313 RepID=UPI001AAE5252|nr:hypothetical protein [Shewanella algae]EKT4489483.1 hypothetical protein [Shewanella algae]MBO2546224.1 hypothetical protein [Shewanella algae]
MDNDFNKNLSQSLTPKQVERLEELQRLWDNQTAMHDDATIMANDPSHLTIFDLRLLLQSHQPLQHLLSQLMHPKGAHEHSNDMGTTTAQSLANGESIHTAPLAQQLAQKDDQLSQQCEQIALLNQQLAQNDVQLAKQREQITLLNQQLTQQMSELEQTRQKWQADSAELARLKSAAVPPVVGFLRKDTELAHKLGLNGLGSELQADLERCIAVLSQLETLKRLWELLKERCEQNQRGVTEAENMLLNQALAWHNHNWHNKPYVLFCPAVGGSYDFSQQQRAATTSVTGEAVLALWLAGLTDGSGRSVKKALVVTG